MSHDVGMSSDRAPALTRGPLSQQALMDLYAPPKDSWVRANFVSTMDGRATGPDGLSGSINSPGDKAVFDALRAFSDVVVVASGTIRAEDYTRLNTPDEWVEMRTAAGRAVHPPLVVVTGSGDVPDRVLEEGPDFGDVLVALTEQTSQDAVDRLTARIGTDNIIVAGKDRVDAATLLAKLRERGWTQVLTEGGPSLLGAWVDSGVIDEIDLTVRPLALGGEGPSILTGSSEALREGQLLSVLSVEHDLMLRYQLSPDT